MNKRNENRKWILINNETNKQIWKDNNIGDEGARMISDGLKCNNALTTLWLSGDEHLKEPKWKWLYDMHDRESENERMNDWKWLNDMIERMRVREWVR